MAHCRGKHKRRNTCNRVIYRCNACGATGCDQAEHPDCTSQSFHAGKCLKCGSTDIEPA
jgi:hypothetical protein